MLVPHDHLTVASRYLVRHRLAIAGLLPVSRGTPRQNTKPDAAPGPALAIPARDEDKSGLNLADGFGYSLVEKALTADIGELRLTEWGLSDQSPAQVVGLVIICASII